MDSIDVKCVVERMHSKPLPIPSTYFGIDVELIEPHKFRSLVKYKAEIATNISFTVENDCAKSFKISRSAAKQKLIKHFWSVFYSEIELYVKLLQEEASTNDDKNIRHISEMISKSVSLDHFIKRLNLNN